MVLNLVDLTPSVRQFMLEEINADIASNKLYISPRLSDLGKQKYIDLLKESVLQQDDAWLAESLAAPNMFNPTEVRRTKTGVTTAKVPYNANEMLAEGEFNRFYLRGLCLYAIQNGLSHLIIYRAKETSNPRPESEAKIGAKIDPKILLEDLRIHLGVDTALGLPAGPNSGLSAKLT